MESRVSAEKCTRGGVVGPLVWRPLHVGWLAPLLFLVVVLWSVAGPAKAADDVLLIAAGRTLAQPQSLALSAAPTVLPANGLSFSTLTADVDDPVGDPVDDGTVVVFSTTLGTFPGGLTITPLPTGVVTAEAESSPVVTVGSWIHYAQPEASNGEVVYSNVVSDKVTYAFTGTAVSVIFQKQYNAGIARVTLDSTFIRDIDTFWDDGSGTGKLFQQEEAIAANLPYAPHVVEVEVTGMKNISATDAYLVVDAFRVYGHDQNGAYLTSSGVATIPLTSALISGTAVVTACADPACDSKGVTFRAPGPHVFFLPLIVKGYAPPAIPVCSELIQNGSFEDETAWVVGSTPRPARYTAEKAHSGARSVLLGLKPGEADVHSYSSVRQAITLPSNTSSATFRFWYYPLSDLDDGDRQECLLLDEDDHLAAILMRTNVNTAAWVQKTYDLSAYAGSTLKVYCNAYNDGDGSGVTGFYLDDVSVDVCTAGPEPPEPPEPPPPDTEGCYPLLLATAGVGYTPHGVAINTAAKRLYVANHGSNSLSVLDSTTYALVTTVGVGAGPNGVAYNPTNDTIYVANRNGNSVTALRASDYGLVKTLAVGLQPNGVAVNEVANRIYVANYGSGTVSVIDGATNLVIQTVAVGLEPAMIAVNPITNKAYVSLHGAEKIARIDGAGNAAQISIHSAAPYGVAVDAVRNLVYVATIESFRIVAVDGNSDTFLGWAEIRRLPGGEPVPLRMVAVNPLMGTSGHIFLTTAGDDLGWDKFLLLPKGWHEYFARAHALPLDEPQEGIAFEPTTLRVFVTSRTGNLVAVYRDGEPACPSNFSLLADHQLTVCIANPDGACRKTITR